MNPLFILFIRSFRLSPRDLLPIAKFAAVGALCALAEVLPLFAQEELAGNAALQDAQNKVSITGTREVEKGGKGFIAWRFQGFQSVRVVGDGMSAIRGARDMVTISPSRTTDYKITALGQGGVRFDTVWRVVALNADEADSAEAEENRLAALAAPPSALSLSSPPSSSSSPSSLAAGENARGSEVFRLPEDIARLAGTNSLESKLYAGILSSSQAAKKSIQRVKIVRIPDNTMLGAFMHVVALDAQGNFIPGLFDETRRNSGIAGALHVELEGKRAEAEQEERQENGQKEGVVGGEETAVAEVAFVAREASLHNSRELAVLTCLDVASYMRESRPALVSAVNDFLSSFGEAVEKHRIYYDHRIALKSVAQQTAQANDYFAQSLEATDSLSGGGLTALYKALYKGVLALRQSGRRHKALVVVAGGGDNASILYALRDVARAAREYGVVVYAVGFGSHADTYALRSIAEYSGGRFYAVEDGEVAETKAILREISLSYKAFYELVFTGGTRVQAHYAAADAVLRYEPPSELVKEDARHKPRYETAPFTLNPQAYYSPHQILATFAPNSFEPDKSLYGAQLGALAAALKDNPESIVELIGHTDMQGADAANRAFALRRAQAVKKTLVALGANPAQIRVRSSGREKPVFYFESEEWQSRVNRRVELRWLDPSLVPFEILAEAVSNEEDAMRLEVEWSARGYEAYYDAFLINRIPFYRLKLWGFPTRESAVKAKDILQRRYRTPLKVQ